jgi:cytosine/adenosine deaminase-related metal-dependent hydrolase
MSTTLIKKGYLLDPHLPFERMDILIEDELITRVAPDMGFQADTVINALDKVVLPGLVNAHTHTYNVLARGLTDNLPLEPWLLYIYSVLAGKMSPREQYVWNTIGAIELLKTGATSLLEHSPAISPLGYESQVDATINAFTDVGIRAVVAPIYTDSSYSQSLPLHLLSDVKPEDIASLNPFPASKTDDVVQALHSIFRRWQNRSSRVSLCLGPGKFYTCSPELMERTAELAAEFNVGIHTHLLETKSQVLMASKKFSRSAVEYLATVNCLGPHVSFAHGVWLDDKDIETLAETNTSVVHNPISNLRLGSGIAPVQTMKARGMNVALGSDDGACNDSVNMFEVMKCASLIGKLYGRPSKWVSAQDAFTMCLTGGAKVLRQKVGSLQPGYLADLVILGTENLFIIPKEKFINQLVFSELGSSVETVLVGGRVVVEDKEVKTVDEKELRAEARDSIQKMYADISSVKKRFAPALDLLERMGTAVAEYELPFSRLARM